MPNQPCPTYHTFGCSHCGFRNNVIDRSGIPPDVDLAAVLRLAAVATELVDVSNTDLWSKRHMKTEKIFMESVYSVPPATREWLTTCFKGD
jgi:hypothetical protein